MELPTFDVKKRSSSKDEGAARTTELLDRIVEYKAIIDDYKMRLSNLNLLGSIVQQISDPVKSAMEP